MSNTQKSSLPLNILVEERILLKGLKKHFKAIRKDFLRQEAYEGHDVRIIEWKNHSSILGALLGAFAAEGDSLLLVLLAGPEAFWFAGMQKYYLDCLVSQSPWPLRMCEEGDFSFPRGQSLRTLWELLPILWSPSLAMIFSGLAVEDLTLLQSCLEEQKQAHLRCQRDVSPFWQGKLNRHLECYQLSMSRRQEIQEAFVEYMVRHTQSPTFLDEKPGTWTYQYLLGKLRCV